MSTIATIMLTTVKQNFRDYKSLMLMLLLPVLLTLILGTALSKVGSDADTTAVLHVHAAIVNQDKSQASQQLAAFYKRPSIRKIISMKPFSSVTAADAAIKAEKIDAIVVVPAGFGQAAAQNKDGSLRFITSGNMEGTVVKSVTESYLKGMNAYGALAASGVSLSAPPSYLSSAITDKPLSAKGKAPGAGDYYAVTMLIMIILYGALYGYDVVHETYRSPIGYRIRTLPINQLDFFIGKALGNIITIFMQIILLIIFDKYIYHANFGTHLLFVFAVCFLLAFIMLSFSIALGLLSSDETTNSLLSLLIPFMTFLAGGYVKLESLATNPITAAIRNFLPNSLAQTMIFQKIYGVSGISISASLTKMVLIALIMVVLISIGVRRVNHGHFAQ